MTNLHKRLFKADIIFMGLLHMLVAFSAMTVVTTVLNFSMPAALLFSGIGTILFHIITKHKLPVTLGVSAAYMGSILAVTQMYGQAYAHGGVIVAGVIYILFGFVMKKWQKQILRFFPSWLLATVVLLIGLSLLPIGVGLMEGGMLIGTTALVVTAAVDMFGGRKMGMLALPLGVLAGFILALFTGQVNFEFVSVSYNYVAPRFNISSILSIGLIAIPTMFEMLGDTENTGDIIGKNVFEEVGIARISFGNGIASILGGFGGSNAYTTYSENAGFLMLSKYYNPDAQLWTGLFFIILSFMTGLLSFIQIIPIQVFGGVVLYLFAMITVNSIKQIANNIDLNTDQSSFSIITLMVALSFVPFTVLGVSISSVAIATVVGVVINTLLTQKGTKKPA